MFPEEFIRRLKSQEYIDSEWLLHSLDEPAKASIRINPAKWNNEPVDASPVPWCKTGFTFKERPSFTADPLFHAGCYYPQEASGMSSSRSFRILQVFILVPEAHISGKRSILG